MRVECKCHGVSGSCEVKTCWKAMPPFRKVGNIIKEKFDGATEVELRKVGTTKVLVPRNSQFKPHTDEDLVYLDPSPDFCEHDPENSRHTGNRRALLQQDLEGYRRLRAHVLQSRIPHGGGGGGRTAAAASSTGAATSSANSAARWSRCTRVGDPDCRTLSSPLPLHAQGTRQIPQHFMRQ